MSTAYQRARNAEAQRRCRERKRGAPRPLSQHPMAVYKRARARGISTRGLLVGYRRQEGRP